MTSPEEEPRPAPGAAAALARRHDEHVREPLGPPDDGSAVRAQFPPAGVRARPREVRLRREARRPRARRRPAPGAVYAHARDDPDVLAAALLTSLRGVKSNASHGLVIGPERVGGVGVAPARRRRRLVVRRFVRARQQLLHRAHGLGVGVVAAPIDCMRLDFRRAADAKSQIRRRRPTHTTINRSIPPRHVGLDDVYGNQSQPYIASNMTGPHLKKLILGPKERRRPRFGIRRFHE